MEHNTPRHSPGEIAELLVAISVVAQNLADELSQHEETQPTPRPTERRRRCQRYTCINDSTKDEWR